MGEDLPYDWVVLEGERYRLVRYGEETLDGIPTYSTPCHICGADPGKRHRSACPMGPDLPHRRPQHCRDCRTPVGEIHYPACCVERCPRCNGQFMSCDCDPSEDSIDEDGPDPAEG